MPIIRLDTIESADLTSAILGTYDKSSPFRKLADHLIQLRKSGEIAIDNPHILVFAGDHGFMAEVIPDKQPTTYQAVQNYISGNAEIMAYCQKNELKFLLCDVGVDGTFAENTPEFVKFKIRAGTRNMLLEPAMTLDECEAALDAGRTLVNGVQYRGCNTVAFGELGRSSLLSAQLLNLRLTGNALSMVNLPSDEPVMHVLEATIDRYGHLNQPMEWLTAMGGFELAAIVGGILQAEENEMNILIDGFVPLVASAMALAIANA